MPLQPYTGPFGTAELRHLLRRTLFGATTADMAHFAGMSLAQVVEDLLSFSNDTAPPIKAYTYPDGNNDPDPALIDPDVAFGSTWVDVVRQPGLDPNPAGQRVRGFQSWWTGLLIAQHRNLREKMVLFWHTNLATQASTVQLPEPLYRMNQLLRDQCLGNYRSLLYDVTVDAAMLIYLNGDQNTAGAPDENYARELLELFTLGEGSGYTEADVQAAARVLTGWKVKENDQGVRILPTVFFNANAHDTADKEFSAFFNNAVIQGQAGANGGSVEINALLDMIFSKEEVSLRLARKLYRFFVHGPIDAAVESAVIVPLAELFRDNATAPDQLRTVLRALFTSDHFFSAEVRACMVSSPADFVIGTLRQLDMPLPNAGQFEARYRIWRDVFNAMAAAGQELGEPPNVAGWGAYYQEPIFDEFWMDSAMYAERLATYRSFTTEGLSTPNNLYQPESQGLQFKVDFVALVQQFAQPDDPNGLVAQAADLLFTLDVSQEVKDQLKTSYLLFGQQNDQYWGDAFQTYVQNPDTMDVSAQLVPSLLMGMFLDMQGAAEHQLL